MTLLIFFIALAGCQSNNTVEEAVPSLHLSLSLRNRLQGRYIQALYDLNAEASATGWTREMHFQAGDLYFSTGNQIDALAHWEAAEPTEPARLRQMVELYISSEHWADATRLLEQLLEQDPQDTWVNYQLGLILAPFDPQRALFLLQYAPQRELSLTERLRATLSEKSNDELVSMYVGVALANMGEWLHAERAFRQAALIAYPYPEAFAYTALARENQGKDGSAWMAEALTTGADHAQVHYLHGLYLRGRFAYEESIQALTVAMSLDASNPAIAAELGIAYQLEFQYERAAFWIQTALLLSNNAPDYLSIAANFYAEAGDNVEDRGLTVLRESAEAYPDNTEILTSYGWALYGVGEVVEAIEQFNAVLGINPEESRALYFLGRIAYDRADPDAARQLLQQVVDLNTEYVPEATSLLEVIADEAAIVSTDNTDASTPRSGYDAIDR
ncbi:MAG: tetratricopeptide repeat protein [Aggregatilineales bacterium]